jgi:putative ubiquitin-RnfH superfamily antitoxin RatB of RatAB toxin-antitoxin module
MAHAEQRGMRIEVVYCAQPGHTDRVSLLLPDGASVMDAVAASGLCQRHGLADGAFQVGIWGRVQPLQTALRDLDRVELYRALQVDPKEARRLRYKRASVKSSAKRAMAV